MDILKQLESSPIWERFRANYEKKQAGPPAEDLEELYLLAELLNWLDTEGVYVTAHRLDFNLGWGVRVIEKETIVSTAVLTKDLCRSRSDALKAGIVCAFNLLEIQHPPTLK